MKLNAVLYMLLLYLHYDHSVARGRTPEHPKMSENCSLDSAAKIFLFSFRKLCTTRWECGTMGWSSVWGVKALGLGWLHAGMGWEASSGPEGAGEPPSGLHRDVKAHRMMGSPGTARNTKIFLPVLGSGTSAQTRWDIECYEMPFEGGQRNPEKAGLWEGAPGSQNHGSNGCVRLMDTCRLYHQ